METTTGILPTGMDIERFFTNQCEIHVLMDQVGSQYPQIDPYKKSVVVLAGAGAGAGASAGGGILLNPH